jgi:hypothetical protein
VPFLESGNRKHAMLFGPSIDYPKI